MTFNRRQLLAAGTAATLAQGFGPAFAQTQSPIDTAKLFVGFPAGTTPDVLARKVGDRLTRGYARAVMVDNRLGAGGQLAVSALKASPADGSSMLITAMSILGVYPHTYKRLPYDPVVDLTPVSNGAIYDFGIGVGPGVPDSVKDIKDLIAWYKANPSRANMASPATGSTLHFVTVMLSRAAGVEITHVGYKGSAPAIQDMLGGTMPALCTPLGSFLGQPKLRVIATCGAKPSRFTPNVSTLVEQGFKDLVYDEWYGFFLPGHAAPDVVKRLNSALHEALADRDVIESLAMFGMEPAPSTPEALADTLKSDTQRWGTIVKSIGFTADS